jgi:RNA polymerase sigma factor (sigma-70 family)
VLPTEPDLRQDDLPQVPQDELEVLRPVVRRVLAACVPRDAVDDLVQETLTRVAEARSQVQGPLEGYAVTTARNLVAERARRSDRDRRYAARIAEPEHDLREPDEGLTRGEDRSHVSAALGRLPERERTMLLAHEVDGVPTAELAERAGTTPGAVAAQLARTRARLRVEYLLVRELVDQLPTDRCEVVLTAISLGERRRLRSARVEEHLVRCPVCRRLAPELRAGRPEPSGGTVRVAVAVDSDVVTARQRAREVAAELGFGPTDQTLVATAVSELARNVVKFADHGEVVIGPAAGRHGITVVVRDSGPGIPDVDAALRDGFSTYSGLGLGLPGTVRLVDDLRIETEPGVGTTVTATKWTTARPEEEEPV